ncbi:MAG: hypothetical protein SPG51_06760, partial [Bariatricus sp.]|nr:hypothetical protein [Bariatricus sp.]
KNEIGNAKERFDKSKSVGDKAKELCSHIVDEVKDVCSYVSDHTCGDGSIAVKGTEVNSVNSLKIKHFRVFGQPCAGCLDTRKFLLLFKGDIT